MEVQEQKLAEVQQLKEFLGQLLPMALDATEKDVSVVLATSSDALNSFIADAGTRALFVAKERTIDNSTIDNIDCKYAVLLAPVYSAELVSMVALLKRQTGVLEHDRAIAAQVQLIHLPVQDGSTAVYACLHSMLHHAVSPFFDAFISARSDVTANAVSAAAAAGKSAMREDKDGRMLAKKKMAELEVSLLHLQQNVDIPRIHLSVNPLLQHAIDRANQAGTRVSVQHVGDVLADSSFLNRLQADVNVWIKEVHKVTKLTRDPSSGTASQEINFWLNMERELEKIDAELKADHISTPTYSLPFYFTETRTRSVCSPDVGSIETC